MPEGVSVIDENTDLDQSVEDLQFFIKEDDSGKRYFDSEMANNAGASNFLRESGEQYNEMFGPKDTGDIDSELGYGNWCGPGHSGPGEPINTLDRLCQTHDQCYAARGWGACSCDNELVANIRENRNNFHGAGERAMVAAVYTYFTHNLCNPFR